MAAHRHHLIRRLVAVRGDMRFLIDVAPRVDYARARHEVALTEHGALFRTPPLELSLSTRRPLEVVNGHDVRAHFAVRAGETATFVLDRVEPGEMQVPFPVPTSPPSSTPPWRYWRGWLRRSRYGGRWREMVNRSALTLKLLTYAPPERSWPPPTTSPAGGSSAARCNWDYRYTWMRDAAFTLYALLRRGFTEEAGAFMNWLQGRFRYTVDRESGPLQIMYGHRRARGPARGSSTRWVPPGTGFMILTPPSSSATVGLAFVSQNMVICGTSRYLRM